MKEIISNKAPSAIGPYSQAVEHNGLIYVSGQLPINAKGEIVQDAYEACITCLKNIQAILEESQSKLENIIQCTIFIKDMNDFAEINRAYSSMLKKPYPARACVEVARLPKDALVELQCIAYK